MTIDKTINDSEVILKVTGRLTTQTAPMLEAEVQSIGNGIRKLVFDFSELEYLSSAGLRVLLFAAKVMGDSGKMIVRNINEVIDEVFRITGFSDVFTIE